MNPYKTVLLALNTRGKERCIVVSNACVGSLEQKCTFISDNSKRATLVSVVLCGPVCDKSAVQAFKHGFNCCH